MFKKGFTLIELVMVIVILAILAAVAVPRYFDIVATAKLNATKASIGVIRSAVAMKYAENITAGISEAAARPATIDGTLFVDGKVPLNQLDPTSDTLGRQVNAASKAGGWTYVQATGVVTSNDTALTDM